METEIDKVVIKGITYVPEDSVKKEVINTEGLEMVMVRTYSAGVFFGYLKSKESTLAGIEVVLLKSRRVYYWTGASTLSQLAMEGTKTPDSCQFPCEIEVHKGLLAIEIIPMTQKAYESLKNVKTWEQ